MKLSPNRGVTLGTVRCQANCYAVATPQARVSLLLAVPPTAHAPEMFMVSEVDAAAIGAAYERGGDLLAAVELRRLFPGIGDNEKACSCARTIAGWRPLPLLPAMVVRLRR
jgi:hypothetical protein